MNQPMRRGIGLCVLGVVAWAVSAAGFVATRRMGTAGAVLSVPVAIVGLIAAVAFLGGLIVVTVGVVRWAFAKETN